jgi:uncharacterized membrane protein
VTALPLSGVIANNGTIAGGFRPAEVDVNGTVTALPPANTGTEALAISNNGQFVGGWIVGSTAGEPTSAVWNLAAGNQFTILEGPFTPTFGQTNGVNNSEQAVGVADLDNCGFAFLYSNGNFIDLGQGYGSSANAINNHGDLVGSGSSGVFVYSNGVTTNLQTVIPTNSGFTLTNAVSINDSGEILGTATDAAGHEHGVLLNPAPSMSLTLTGFPTTTTAGVAHNVTVTVLNPDGTVDTGYTGTVHFTSSDS